MICASARSADSPTLLTPVGVAAWRATSTLKAREILAFGIYRIIYEIDEPATRVNILRFWHAHRREPRVEL